jgi:hypothetical protein
MITEKIMAIIALIDLNPESPKTHTPKIVQRETADEFRKNDFCSTHGLYTHIRISKVRRTLQPQFQSPELLLLGSVPHNGVCSTDLSPKLERYRGLSPYGSCQTPSHGLSQQDFAQHSVQFKLGARLAHLFRFRAVVDLHRSQSPCRRRLRNSSKENRLRIGCSDNRSLPVAFSLGSLSQTQGRSQTAHSARSTRQHPHSNNHYRRQNSRGRHTRSNHLGSRRDLLDGSRLSGFLKPIKHPPVRRLLHYQSKKTIRLQTTSLNASRQDPRSEIGSSHYAEKLLPETEISRTIAAHSLPRSRNKKASDLLNRQFPSLCSDYYRPLSMPQMEQFFRWIKQHLRIKAFYGTTENAVKTQIW